MSRLEQQHNRNRVVSENLISGLNIIHSLIQFMGLKCYIPLEFILELQEVEFTEL